MRSIRERGVLVALTATVSVLVLSGCGGESSQVAGATPTPSSSGVPSPSASEPNPLPSQFGTVKPGEYITPEPSRSGDTVSVGQAPDLYDLAPVKPEIPAEVATRFGGKDKVEAAYREMTDFTVRNAVTNLLAPAKRSARDLSLVDEWMTAGALKTWNKDVALYLADKDGQSQDAAVAALVTASDLYPSTNYAFPDGVVAKYDPFTYGPAAIDPAVTGRSARLAVPVTSVIFIDGTYEGKPSILSRDASITFFLVPGVGTDKAWLIDGYQVTLYSTAFFDAETIEKLT